MGYTVQTLSYMNERILDTDLWYVVSYPEMQVILHK